MFLRVTGSTPHQSKKKRWLIYHLYAKFVIIEELVKCWSIAGKKIKIRTNRTHLPLRLKMHPVVEEGAAASSRTLHQIPNLPHPVPLPRKNASLEKKVRFKNNMVMVKVMDSWSMVRFVMNALGISLQLCLFRLSTVNSINCTADVMWWSSF